MICSPRINSGVWVHASNSQRPSSRNANRDSQEGCLMKRTDSSRSMLEPGTAEPRASKDNIRVAVRLRPLSEKERIRGDAAVWATDGSGGVGLFSTHSNTLNIKYAYDLVFDTATNNAQVFDYIGRSTVEPITQGISGTLFAYGVTSSGKTHTMMGTAADPGLVPRAIQELFRTINQSKERVFTVTMSMLEIYCEMLNDLLDPSKLNLDVQERELPNGRGSVLQVKGLTETKVASAEAALGIIQQGLDNRKVGTTAYNDQSSRSHTLCRFLVESAPATSSSNATTTGATTRTSAWLTLVDLAGSEGAKAALSKDQQAEARDINRSLLTLGKVVFELAKGNGHVPFRDSLLTRLLKPSLTGNGAKVAIICNVTPASSQSEETWNTLRFADGAKRIKVSVVKSEALDVAAIVAQYQREVEALKAQLAVLSGAAAAGGVTPAVLQAMQASLQDSSTANAADQLADQEAQMRYLAECNSNLNKEREQLLQMNRKMMAMLVEQIRSLGGSGSCSRGNVELNDGLVTATALRRSLSFESAQLYSCWQGSWRQRHHHQQGQTPVSDLLRMTAEDVPNSITGAVDCPAATRAMLRTSSSSCSLTLPAVSATGAASATQQGGSSPQVPLLEVPVVQGSIYFPCSKRISKTLALAVPGMSPPSPGSEAAAWLGPVATVAAAVSTAAGCSAVSEAVEAHRLLADCKARLDLLLQQLEDKETLLKEARQMQEGQALQLRLTITSADRALLRDKLAEAEQQLASYQSILKEYEAEKEELYNTAYSLYGKVLELTEQKQMAAGKMSKVKSRVEACLGSRTAAPCSASTTPTLSARDPLITARPRSANAAVGSRSAVQQSVNSSAASPPPGALQRCIPSPPPAGSSTERIGLYAAKTIPKSPRHGTGVGLANLNPICIMSPFSNPAAAAAAVGGSSPGGMRRIKAGRTVSESSSEEAQTPRSPQGSPSHWQSVSSTPPLLSTALSSGTSRIPLPPCLQRRPKQLQATDAHLLRFVRGQSRLPAAPGSNGSSVTSSTGGMVHSSSGSSLSGLPMASAGDTCGGAMDGLAPASAGTLHVARAGLSSTSSTHGSCHTRGPSTLSECTSGAVISTSIPDLTSTLGTTSGNTRPRPCEGAAVATVEEGQDQNSCGSSSLHAVLTPANRLESQPSLVAVAAALGHDAASSDVCGEGDGLASEASKVEDLKKLWEAISQAGAVVKLSDEDHPGVVGAGNCEAIAGDCHDKQPEELVLGNPVAEA